MNYLVNYYDENDERVEAVVEATSRVEAKNAVPSDRVNWVRLATEEEAADAQQDDEGGQPPSQSADDPRQASPQGGDGSAPDNQTPSTGPATGAPDQAGEGVTNEQTPGEQQRGSDGRYS